MNCPTCHIDLTESIDRGVTTGLWRFRIKCNCGDILIWERNRLRQSKYSGTTPEHAFVASSQDDRFFS